MIESQKSPRSAAMLVVAAVLAVLAVLAVGCTSDDASPRSAAPSSSQTTSQTSSSATQSSSRVALQHQLDAVVKAGAPGALLRVDGRDGAWSVRSGVADQASKTPMPYGAHFRVGSVTKLFTASLLLRLVEDRTLGLDDPLSRWLPGILPKLDGTKITVRMLLGHTSGVPEYVGVLLDRVAKDPAELMRAHSMHELVTMVADQKPDFAPGARWAYSNTNYILLGLIAEKAGGASYASQLQQRILTPLHLSNTLPPLDSTDLPLPHAVGYTPGPDGSLEDITELNPTIAASAGGVTSSVDDLTAFIRALLGGRLLSAGMLAEMTPSTGSASPGTTPGYGLGMMRQDLRCGVSVYGHNGSIPGFGTLLLSTLDGRRALAVSINTDPSMRTDLATGALIETYFCGRQ